MHSFKLTGLFSPRLKGRKIKYMLLVFHQAAFPDFVSGDMFSLPLLLVLCQMKCINTEGWGHLKVGAWVYGFSGGCISELGLRDNNWCIFGSWEPI